MSRSAHPLRTGNWQHEGRQPGREMRYGRVIVNLVIVGACAGLIALEIAGPGNPAPTGRPTDTFTHLDVKVDDRGVHIPVRNVAAGNVEITLTDARTHKANPLTVTSNP